MSNKLYSNFLLACIMTLIGLSGYGQNIIGGSSGDPTALLDLQSTDKGLLIPRMSTEQRSAINNPAGGLLIYNTSLQCLELNIGSAEQPVWSCLTQTRLITSLACEGLNQTGALFAGEQAVGVGFTIPYSGGNGFPYLPQSFSSTGVTGLVATLEQGNFASSGGELVFTLSGAPSGIGTASFNISIGGQTCVINLTVGAVSFNCGDVSHLGSLMAGDSAIDVISTVDYTGGNGGSYNISPVASTGVSGLTLTLTDGNFVSGNGTWEFTISGVPGTTGTAIFSFSIAGQSCVITREVGTLSCGAYVAEGVWKQFMCHNLGANTGADPFMPSWEINGDYYQWGRSGVAAAGPSGPGTTEANAAVISGWNTSIAPSGAWSDASKTANDPCPTGFRVPTYTQWLGVLNINLNTITFIGSNWSSSATNYTTGLRFGNSLFLPAAGYRGSSNGALLSRGINGRYWSSTEFSSSYAWYLTFNSSSASRFNNYRTFGFSVRCIAE